MVDAGAPADALPLHVFTLSDQRRSFAARTGDGCRAAGRSARQVVDSK
jgi:hypothetical protein